MLLLNLVGVFSATLSNVFIVQMWQIVVDGPVNLNSVVTNKLCNFNKSIDRWGGQFIANEQGCKGNKLTCAGSGFARSKIMEQITGICGIFNSQNTQWGSHGPHILTHNCFSLPSGKQFTCACLCNDLSVNVKNGTSHIYTWSSSANKKKCSASNLYY